MKKLLSISLITALLAITTPVEHPASAAVQHPASAVAFATTTDPQPITTDPANWYQYNGDSLTHTFSVKFPPEWKTRIFNDEYQGFGPAINAGNENAEPALTFSIREFEAHTFQQAINFYLDTNTSLFKIEDIILPQNEDLAAKHATFLNITNNQTNEMYFIKRGTLVLGITEPIDEITTKIFNSFQFTDNWQQYIDSKEKYTFIFPKSLAIKFLDDGLTIIEKSQPETPIFSITKFGNTDTDKEDIAEAAEGYGQNLQQYEDIYFHDIENVFAATYEQKPQSKNFRLIFVPKNNAVYALTDNNIESNFPRSDYYDQFLFEILESFEFIELADDYSSYKYFPDVRENHANAPAIDALRSDKIIAGYPDGSFKPDGEINRAELTKLVVASQIEPSKENYKDCFPDVTNEWFAPYICYAKARNWVIGNPNGNFQPEKPINRAEALKIILEVLIDSIPETTPLSDTSVQDISLDAWYLKYFAHADNNNYLDKQHILEQNGKYFYYPANNITRKEVAETIYRILHNPL